VYSQVINELLLHEEYRIINNYLGVTSFLSLMGKEESETFGRHSKFMLRVLYKVSD